MTDDMYDAITRVAREFRAYRTADEHPNKTAGGRLHVEWPQLWGFLETLQREWLE